ncbi:hypothetical protein GMD32_05285 [Parasutterella excrementihominis]|uniref:hypothetical protein n=1 Tax=Parasutterella excrementihominis TaxID=487175 RepID=UPI00142A1F48|nr:hypothetical protein [Parasutterella excrementihominis]MTU20942.1 hypothetical protein [Parasutterella excrementihominis]
MSDEGKKGRSSPKEQTHCHEKIGCRFIAVKKKSGACDQQTQDPRKEHHEKQNLVQHYQSSPTVDIFWDFRYFPGFVFSAEVVAGASTQTWQSRSSCI